MSRNASNPDVGYFILDRPFFSYELMFDRGHFVMSIIQFIHLISMHMKVLGNKIVFLKLPSFCWFSQKLELFRTLLKGIFFHPKTTGIFLQFHESLKWHFAKENSRLSSQFIPSF